MSCKPDSRDGFAAALTHLCAKGALPRAEVLAGLRAFAPSFLQAAGDNAKLSDRVVPVSGDCVRELSLPLSLVCRVRVFMRAGGN